MGLSYCGTSRWLHVLVQHSKYAFCHKDSQSIKSGCISSVAFISQIIACDWVVQSNISPWDV